MKKNNTTLKTPEIEDTSSIEDSAIDTFLFLRSIERENGDLIKIELLPEFIESLAVEIEELKILRDQILR